MSKFPLFLFFGAYLNQLAGATPPWACALKPCILKSPLAFAGPSFKSLMEFKAMGAEKKSEQEQCPFGGDDGPPPSEKEYKGYMTGLDKIGDMSPAERAAWAHKVATEAKQMSSEEVEAAERRAQEKADADRKMMEAQDRAAIQPSVDVSAPGVEVVNDVALNDLRNKKEYDILVTFYAPWCPHCKAFVTNSNAPITALSASLEEAHGPKVVTFDVTASSVPSDLQVDSVPTIYLIRKTGLPVAFKEDPHDLARLKAFALEPNPAGLLATSARKHLRSIKKRLRGPGNPAEVSPQDSEEVDANTDEEIHAMDDSDSQEDNTFHHSIDGQEEFVDPKDAWHDVGAEEEFVPVHPASNA